MLIFQEGTDLLKARQLVQERLAVEASRLPAVARPPVILSLLFLDESTPQDRRLLQDTLGQMDLTVLARWTIRPRLMAIPGVANVAIWGQRDKQFQVLVDPDRLRDHKVTLSQVTQAVADASAVTAGGFVDGANQRIAVRYRSPIRRSRRPRRDAVVVIRNGGTPLRIGDVADVQIGFPAPIGDAIINDVPGLLLIVEKQPNAQHLLEVTRNVEAALDALRPGLEGGRPPRPGPIFRPADSSSSGPSTTSIGRHVDRPRLPAGRRRSSSFFSTTGARPSSASRPFPYPWWRRSS